MTAKEYIDKFKMNQENYEFNRQEFITQLKFEFLESIQGHPKYNTYISKLQYKYFRELVKQFQDKFDEISRLKNGKPLSQGLWKAFYAGTVVAYRTEHYPQVQEHITRIRQGQASVKVKS